MTPSEKLVSDLCTRTFLSLWSYASPQRSDGRELCDALVVFGENIVIVSVKEIALSDHPDQGVVERRWTKKAIDDSVKQLSGAKRILASMSHVIRNDGAAGVSLPSGASRRVHLVAVAAGANRTLPIASGDRDVGYVHVLDEIALRTVLSELDTTPDFLHYLQAKEGYRGAIACEGEENLLGVYLQAGRILPDQHMLLIDGDVWSEIAAKPEFVARKAEDKVSYWWDRTIEVLIRDYKLQPESGASPSEHELLVRTMAAENRFARRALSGAFLDWLLLRKAGARNLVSQSGIAYVFGTYPRDCEREYRVADLGARCFVARSRSGVGKPTVIGIATEIYDPSGYSLDAVYLHMPDWTDEDEQKAQEARRRFGIMKAPERSVAPLEEFPLPKTAKPTRTERNRRKRERKRRR